MVLPLPGPVLWNLLRVTLSSTSSFSTASSFICALSLSKEGGAPSRCSWKRRRVSAQVKPRAAGKGPWPFSRTVTRQTGLGVGGFGRRPRFCPHCKCPSPSPPAPGSAPFPNKPPSPASRPAAPKPHPSPEPRGGLDGNRLVCSGCLMAVL